MTPELEAHLAQLEAKLAAKPDSQRLREQVLEAFCSEDAATADPRRVRHIVEYVQRFPHTSFARCPLAHLRTDAPPEAHAAVEAQWQQHFDEHPSDPLIVRGLAGCVACRDRERAGEILEAFVCDVPDAEVWMDLGRIHPDPQARLAGLLQARKLGSDQPNLLTWIMQAALALDDFELVESSGNELLARAAEARRMHGDRLDWKDGSLRERARAVTASNAEATALIFTIMRHAQHVHWGHTAIGLVAAQRGDRVAAIEHLHASISVRPDPGLTSYGPSFRLAEALCKLQAWSEVAAYLEACEAFWKVETLRAYRSEVEQQRIPEFEHD